MQDAVCWLLFAVWLTFLRENNPCEVLYDSPNNPFIPSKAFPTFILSHCLESWLNFPRIKCSKWSTQIIIGLDLSADLSECLSTRVRQFYILIQFIFQDTWKKMSKLCVLKNTSFINIFSGILVEAQLTHPTTDGSQ